MEEIRELQRRLYEAQQGKSVNRLTDDNVVELVAKLIDRNLVELHLSGQGYITPKQLRNEIKDELLVSGGRISLTALHATINTDASVIEAKVDEMCAEDPDGLTLEQGQLIADYYLEDLATELNTELQEAGQITLGSFATRYNFSTDFLSLAMRPRMGTTIDGRMEAGGVVYTTAFVERHLSAPLLAHRPSPPSPPR